MTRRSVNTPLYYMSGALSYDMFLMDEEADAIAYYESIRNMGNEEYRSYIQTISNNIGFDIEAVDTIIHHICFNEYELVDGRFERFDEDPYMMRSLQRLYDNNYYDCDLVLMEHELMEYNYIAENGLSAGDAHLETVKVFDYDAALNEASSNGLDI